MMIERSFAFGSKILFRSDPIRKSDRGGLARFAVLRKILLKKLNVNERLENKNKIIRIQ